MKRAFLLAGLALVLLSIVLSFWAYPSLPARVPTHWDLSGHPNGYSSRLFAASFIPALAGFTWLLMIVLPLISPRGFRLDQSATAFYESILAVIAVLVVLHFVILRAGEGASEPPYATWFVPIGVLLVILGNLMGKFRKNFFIGVRTPWTLASDEVWLRTNRLGGRLMVVGGLLLIAASAFQSWVIPTLLTVVVAISIVPLLYSYFLYKRLEGFGPNGEGSF